LLVFYRKSRSADRLDRVKGTNSQKILPKTKPTLLKSRKRVKKSIKLPKSKNKRNKLTEEKQVRKESEMETEDDYISEFESSSGEYVTEQSNSDSEVTKK